MSWDTCSGPGMTTSRSILKETGCVHRLNGGPRLPRWIDVAWMLRSLSYAAQAGLVHHASRRAGELQDLRAFARLWEQQTSSVFLKTYCEGITDTRLLPAGNDLHTLLEIFILERAFHELQYEINNRPQFIHIPLYGLLSILEGE